MKVFSFVEEKVEYVIVGNKTLQTTVRTSIYATLSSSLYDFITKFTQSDNFLQMIKDHNCSITSDDDVLYGTYKTSPYDYIGDLINGIIQSSKKCYIIESNIIESNI